MRNFWITLDTGKAKPIATGPRTKEGGFDLTIAQRFNGASKEVLEVIGRCDSEGKLTLTVWSNVEGGTLTARKVEEVTSER